MNEAGTDSGGGKQNFYTPMWGNQETGRNPHFSQGHSGQVPNGFAPIDPTTIQTVPLDQLIRDDLDVGEKDLNRSLTNSQKG